MTEYEALATFVVSLFTILNPFGNIAIYLGVTAGIDAKQNSKVAFKMCIAVFCILILSIWVGAALLNFFGISITAFRIAGGLVIGLIALRILGYLPESHKTDDGTASAGSNSIAIVPLAIPIVAGPGAIVTTISHSRHYFPDVMHKVVASVTCLIVVSIIFIFFLLVPKIASSLGQAKIEIISKVMGLLLLGISIEMIIEALQLLSKAGI
ncbi:MAG: MarC family protein [Francisellaceae bacterium]